MRSDDPDADGQGNGTGKISSNGGAKDTPREKEGKAAARKPPYRNGELATRAPGKRLALVPEPAAKPKICCNPGRIAEATKQAFDLLANEPNPFEAVYVRGQTLMRVVRYKKNGKPKDNIERPDGATLLNPVIADWLTLHFNKSAEWFAWKAVPKKEGEFIEVAKDAPEQVARFIMASSPWDGLPILNGVINAPTILLDGRIVQEPGYDAATGLLFDPDGTTFPKIPENPTKDDAKAALEFLRQPFKGFPFADKDQPSPAAPRDGDENLNEDELKAEIYRRRCKTVSASVALSAVITALVRKSLRIAPQFAFDAPTPSSGKTLLASCPSLIATGRPPMLLAPNLDPEAERKSLFAALLEGPGSIVVDNIEGEYGSSVLNAILTTEEYTERFLGLSKQVKVPTNAMFSCTGNNLVIKGDLGARTQLCRIDPEKEDPDDRTFDVDLHKELPRRRAEIVVAALTIVKAYLANPKKHKKEAQFKDIPDYSRFDEWQQLCRFPLIWLECEDPCKSRENIRTDDPETVALRNLLVTWSDVYKNGEATVGGAIADCDMPSASDKQKALLEALRTVGQQGSTINATKAGKFISDRAGRIIEDKCFGAGGKDHSARKWKVNGWKAPGDGSREVGR